MTEVPMLPPEGMPTMTAFADEEYRAYLRQLYVDNECDGEQYSGTQPAKGLNLISHLAQLVAGDFEQSSRLATLTMMWCAADPSDGKSGSDQFAPIAAWYFDVLWNQGKHPYTDDFTEFLDQHYDGDVFLLEMGMQGHAPHDAQSIQVRSLTRAWMSALDIVSGHYPKAMYQFSQAGPSIEITLNDHIGLVFGTCNEFIGADVNLIDQWNGWQTTGQGIDTNPLLLSDCTEDFAIANAIIGATRQFENDLRFIELKNDGVIYFGESMLVTNLHDTDSPSYDNMITGFEILLNALHKEGAPLGMYTEALDKAIESIKMHHA